MPWTEIDYLMGPATCVPLYQQLKAEFPEVQAVNAMYTHGLLAIISTKKRYGGFARAVGLRAMTTPHGLGYVKMVIMVDEDVDPFNLPQVMWALSSKVNPAGFGAVAEYVRAGTRPRLKPGRYHRQADYRRHHACRPGQPWSLQPAGGGFTGNQSLG